MPVAAPAKYLIHKPTKRIVIEGAKAYPKGDLEPYDPPTYLRKIDGANKGKLFPWSYLMAQRRDMVPYDGDPANPPPLPEKHKPTGKAEFKSEGRVGETTDEELLESDELQPVPKEPVEEIHVEPKAETADDAPGILDKLCVQNGTTREQEIINAIGRLDVNKGFGGKGLPRMEALYKELDDTVGYQEMLAAWKIVKEGKQ
jgi:hypothetical protein